MEKELLAKLNKVARETGKSHAALKQDIYDALFGEADGLHKWVNLVTAKLRRPTEHDRENLRIFEEAQRQEALAARMRVYDALFGSEDAAVGGAAKAKAREKSFTDKEAGRRKASAPEGQAEGQPESRGHD